MVKKRKEVLASDKWNVEKIYASKEQWEQTFAQITKAQAKGIYWPHLTTYKGKIGTGAPLACELLDLYFNIEKQLSKLAVYARLRHDEDVTDHQYKEMNDRICALCYTYQSETAWIDPEILQLPQATVKSYLADPLLNDYHFYLKKIFDLKPHTLDNAQEQLLSMAAKPLQVSRKAFTLFNNADLHFGLVKDQEGKEHELTHGSSILLLRSKDRTLRKESGLRLQGKYLEFQNTFTELLNGQVQRNVFHAKVRNYPSALHAALTPHQIDVEVCYQLIATVRKHLPKLHRYIALRKKILGYDTLHFYDLHVPLISEVDKSYSYEEAVDLTLAATKPLGEEYNSILERGLKEERWVDRYENAQKRSGAYSSGSYDTSPYILLNFQGTLRDVITLAHEAGHSMHSYYSNRNQPFHYADYSIFLAEIASTFNEELLFDYLLDKLQTPKERALLLLQKIEDIRGTLFRQTLFGEFELLIHKVAEEDHSLTPSVLRKEYAKLYRDYHGDLLEIEPECEVEYLRIPHLYLNFYVYQYATGLSAANSLMNHFRDDPEKGRASYLNFLSAGSSSYPLKLLEDIGVNMRSPLPVEQLIHRFDSLVSQFESEFSAC